MPVHQEAFRRRNLVAVNPGRLEGWKAGRLEGWKAGTISAGRDTNRSPSRFYYYYYYYYSYYYYYYYQW